MVRRGALGQMLATAVVVGVVTTILVADPWDWLPWDWLPESASEEMERIADVYWFATAISIAVFAVVAAALVYAIQKFRAQPEDDTDGPPIHGNTRLEVIWTVIPALLVIAIGVWSAIVLSQNGEAGSNPLRVQVTAQQFAWYFDYPDQGVERASELVLPVDRGVELEFRALDVIHSFWVPEMGQKQDVVPGIDTGIVITPTRTGTFPLVCTELCGLGHPTMRSTVRVVSEEEFQAWADEQAGGAEAAAAESED